MRAGNLVLLLLGVCALSALAPATALAEEPWEVAARQAEEEQDRLLAEAKRRKTTGQLVRRYASRVSRQPTALNHYLLGRAMYYDKDVAGAERQLQQVLRLAPRFWHARLRLGMLSLERKRLPEAEAHVTQVLRQRPQEPDALRLMAQIRMDAQDWDRALQVLDTLLSLEPTSLDVRQNIASALMAKGDWKRAVKELRILRGRAKRNPMVLFFYATALQETEQFREASIEFEGLLRLDPKNVAVLDKLRMIYFQLKDWKGLEKTLERMVPLVEDEKIRGRISEMLTQLKKGVPEPGEGERPEEWPEDSWLALVERSMHPTNVEVRRKALQIYHAKEFPQVPHALVNRIHWEHEPDGVCRSWILRIVASMQNPQLAQVVAYSLWYDPESRVRTVAAETLGELGTPSGILYLMPALLGSSIADPPTEAQQMELNGARRSLILLTERRDTLGGAETWVPAESLGAMREDWMRWLATEDGIHARLRAIADLEEQKDAQPERVLIEDVSDPDMRIARAAYQVLLRRSRMPSDEAVAAKLWPEFPRFGPDDLTPERMGRVRQAVAAWWARYQQARN